MSGNNSLERRYSFNTSQVIPMAESTQLNGSGFSWGSVSPRARSSSVFKSPSSSSYVNNEIIAHQRNKHLSKIDARIAADVQSKGLASRIVKYQESGSRLNRSLSAHNLFTKPGQFPTVTLKKSNLPFRAAKRELSMIRIPPPDKSSFYGNTVSSLLRSSSVIGLQTKSNDDVSTENRPIIHPPPTENDMAPTRSVLDVLKEISRKRINSDELESAENSKKYCGNVRIDYVDAVGDMKSSSQEKYLAWLPSPPQRHKRQRDCVTSQQSVNLIETKTSPEQAKKRICNYNNDITSSLSSSIKCKKVGTFQQNLNQTLPTKYSPAETKNLREQHKSEHTKTNNKHGDMRFKNIENSWKKAKTHNHSTHISEASAGCQQNNCTVACQNVASEPTFDSQEKIANGLEHTAHKPRLTLFNKKFDDRESESYDVEEKKDDCLGIPFVKPKKIASNSGLRNSLMERTKKSKLALMLSGLKGELYQSSALDEVDTTCEKEKGISTVNNSNTFTSPTKPTNNIPPTLTTVTSTTTVSSTSTVETPTSVKTTLSSTSSPLVGLKLTFPSENVSNMLNAKDAAKTTCLQSQPNVPVLGGFSLCATPSTSTSTVQSCSSLESESKSTAAQISTIPATISTQTPKSSIALFTHNDKMGQISEKALPAANNNVIQFPAASTAGNLTTSNANAPNASKTLNPGKTFTAFNVSSYNNGTTATTTSSNLPSNNFQVIVTSSPVSAVSSTPIVFSTSKAPIANKTNGFNFSTPSATSQAATASSFAPIVFGVSSNSAKLTETIPTASVSSVKSSADEQKAVNTTINPFNPSSASGLFTFNTQPKSSSNQVEKNSVGGTSTSTLSFNFDRNKTENSASAFGMNNSNTINFKFEAKTPNVGDQGNQKNETKNFSFNSPAQFDAKSLNTKAIGSSILDNAPRKSNNNIFSSSGVSSIFAPQSVKGGTEAAKSNTNNKSEVLVTPSSDKNNTNKTTPFSFVPNTTSFASTSSSNVNTQAGGFSFTTAISNSPASGKTESLNQTFSASPSQNNFMFGPSSNKLDSSNIFGASTSKPENVSQGGFSFGVGTPTKTSTFTFGADKTPKNDAVNTTTASKSFSFGTSADAKQNASTTNKPFSFGSPQPVQPNQSDSSSAGNTFNIFGTSTKAAQPPAFNFTSGSSQPNSATNLFAPPNLNVSTGPGDRPIRRATRRLQK